MGDPINVWTPLIRPLTTAVFGEVPMARVLSTSVVRALVAMSVTLTAGCASAPPKHQDNLCAIFDQYPEWYDAAKNSQDKWGTPPHILMAFVKQESAFRHDARPPRDWFLFIPLGRRSSAVGYAQAKDEAWEEYENEVGGFFNSRSDMENALDFIGWYNNKSNKHLGISKWDPKRMYLAYHEGRGGYARGSYKSKPGVVRMADDVDRQAREYGAQLRRCEDRFRCRHWYQIWPFCR